MAHNSTLWLRDYLYYSWPLLFWGLFTIWGLCFWGPKSFCRLKILGGVWKFWGGGQTSYFISLGLSFPFPFFFSLPPLRFGRIRGYSLLGFYPPYPLVGVPSGGNLGNNLISRGKMGDKKFWGRP